MCEIIIINETEIETCEQLLDLTGILIPAYGYNAIKLDACLCQINIPLTLSRAGLDYMTDESAQIFYIMKGLKNG